MPRQTWTDEDSDKLRALHSQGLSLGRSAEAMGKPPQTVSRWARKLGLSWERPEALVKASQARTIDAAAHLSAYALEAAETARYLLGQVRQPATYVELGKVELGVDGWHERTQDEPTAVDKRNLAQAAATTVGAVMKILDRDSLREAGSDIDAWLEHMTDGPAT